ncbi:MAG: hypothetical protein ABIO70_27520 [Pseudomonadota bacterium]
MPPSLTSIAAQVRYDLKAGRCWAAVFATADGEAILEYRTPRGALYAERPRLVLWRQGSPARILANLDLTTADHTAIDPLLARGADLAGDERPLYDLLLRQVRAHHLGQPRRHRTTPVGEAVASTGSPSLDAWASCLALGDLQAALLAALEPEVGRAA